VLTFVTGWDTVAEEGIAEAGEEEGGGCEGGKCAGTLISPSSPFVAVLPLSCSCGVLSGAWGAGGGALGGLGGVLVLPALDAMQGGREGVRRGSVSHTNTLSTCRRARVSGLQEQMGSSRGEDGRK
jgi:hypothetical protein